MTIPNFKKGFFMATGSLCLALGIVGIFVPLLPTTPFLLLAAACFFRGSDRMYHWLLNHRLFGSHIRNYRRFHAVSMKAKMASIIVLWLFIGFGMVFVAQVIWGRILLGVVAVGVTVFLTSLKTVTKEMNNNRTLLEFTSCGRVFRPGSVANEKISDEEQTTARPEDRATQER